MSRSITPFGLRMPPEIRAWLQSRASNNLRSLNAEIVAILAAAHAQEQQQKTG